jgi:hypothetical protein
MEKQPIRTFAWAFLGHWWELMSCAVFTGLSIYIAQANRSNAWFVSASAVVAIAFLLVAAYRTWKDEYVKRCQFEDQLNSEADMRGTVWIRHPNLNPYADQARAGSNLAFVCDCSNHGRKTCQISKFHVRIAPIAAKGFEGYDNFVQLPLSYITDTAHGQQFYRDYTVLIPGLMPDDLAQAEIVVSLVDALGPEYKNTVTKMGVSAKVPF